MSDRSARELLLIERFRELTETTNSRVVQGIGDDAAVIEVADSYMVVSTDTAVEGVHFSYDYMSAAQIGSRAATTALSDLAAMAAEPGELYLAVAAPQHLGSDYLEKLYSGVLAAARQVGAAVAGGDFTTSEQLVLTVTVVGYCSKERPPVMRSGANLGDLIGLTGPVGGAGAGLVILQDRASVRDSYAVESHLCPTARVVEGQHLAGSGVSSLIDISDGIATDANHLAAASGVQLLIDLDRVPLGPAVCEVAAELRLDPREFAVTAGDDYELCFTVNSELKTVVEQQLDVIWIGEVAAGSGVKFHSTDGRDWSQLHGFEH